MTEEENTKITEISSAKSFGGLQKTFSHASKETKTTMKFGVYLPHGFLAGENRLFPVLYWLSGLTCTEENFIQKSGFQRFASEHGIVVVNPDTSPRGLALPGEDDAYDFGSGAGFYVDATQAPWSENYRMYSYVTSELPAVVAANFPVHPTQQSIFGHSMGGHGALVCALRNPEKYRSVSAFAPIAHPVACPWGKKAFGGYLGADDNTWQEYDSTVLAGKYTGPKLNVLVDQGDRDGFLNDPDQLRPKDFTQAAESNASLQCKFRFQQGYDHGFYFIATFIEEHIKFHAVHLKS